jgi:radical SAM superfamily enzyme YgiQ (UPF0313 family)
MTKKFAIVAMIIASLFRAEVAYTGEPMWILWGNPDNIRYDAQSHIWINDNASRENVFVAMDLYEIHRGGARKYSLPESVPEKKTTTIVFRMDTATKPELFYAQMLVAGALQQTKRRFVLINVEQTLLDLTSDKDRQYRTWPHLGILYVGTIAHQEGYEVVLWDELVQGQADLTKLVQPGDIVGLSLVVTGIERGVELAKQAKQLGAECVIAGNDSATFRVNQLLELPGRPIDAVFTSNSLRPVRLFFLNYGKYFTWKDLRYMRWPGMDGRPGTQVRSNEHVVLLGELQRRKQLERTGSFDLEDTFLVPKLDLFSKEYWEEVWTNYSQVFGHKHTYVTRNASALLAQGCTRTRGVDVCSYCTIADVANIRIPSEEYLRRTMNAYDEFGIEMVFNTTDSAYEMTGLVKRLQTIAASFHSLIIYGRAQGIAQNPGLLDDWQTMVEDRFLINVGMDSGDAKILDQGVEKSSLGKGSRLDENVEAVRRIKEFGAHLHYSLIFGSPGETIDSCERSVEFLEWSIATLGPQLDLVETDVYWLNFGSPAGAIFHDFEHAQRLAAIAGKTITREEWQRDFARHSNELIVPDSVERSWYQHFTNIDFDTAQEYNKRCAEIMARHEGAIAGRAYKPVKEDT